MSVKKKYEAPIAYDLTGVVQNTAHAQACKYGGSPTQSQCSAGAMATARCKTGTIAGGQCTSGFFATYTCRRGSLPNL